ncbi:CTRB [Mytilus edulis]|uniref:CTRB n=1 Tax=Mytilus edulis TaxID=6550 RepID=A0A8S3V2A6_MYTED|nr:CTRB [Mytilus edulis]
MWNEVFIEHRQISPMCTGFISWDLSAEQQRGAAWREKASCNECSYHSKMFNLYNEVIAKKRGRRTAAINLSIQVALNHIAISTTGLQKLFLGSNIPAPSTSSMQHFADGMYNNPIYSGMGKTPFQPVTQCTYNMLENNTYKHSIVSTRQVSKLCSNKSEHKTKTKVKSHKGHCSANIEMHDSIGSEERWAKDCLLDLKNDGLEVQEITTDPDSSAFRAAESLFKAGTTNTQPIHFLDTRHVSANHRNFIKKMSGLKEIMPARLVSEKVKMLKKFALDMAARCQAEYNAAFDKFNMDPVRVKVHLSYACHAIVSCYQGDHNRKVERPNKSENTAALLRECVKYRLGPTMLNRTCKNTNTQKAKATNRAIRATVPSNVTFTRNYKGRVHTAIHNVNNGPGESIVKLCKAAWVPIEPGSRAARGLKNIQQHNEKHKLYKQSKQYTDQRCSKKHELYKIYDEYQEEKDYDKNKLLPTKRLAAKQPQEASDYRIAAGSSFLSQMTVFRSIKRIFMHEFYEKPLEMDNDIMLIELWTPLSFGSTINKITLDDSKSNIFVGDICKVSGWGQVNVTLGPSGDPDRLQLSYIPVITNEVCALSWPLDDIGSSKICLRKNGTDVCFGDSGGPVICKTNDGINKLVGLTSFGPDECDGIFGPGVYTKVSFFLNWIKNKMNMNLERKDYYKKDWKYRTNINKKKNRKYRKNKNKKRNRNYRKYRKNKNK